MSSRLTTLAQLRRPLMSLLIVGSLGGVATMGAFSAFSSTTTNGANSFAAGTVNLGDNDAGTALYTVTNRKPGDTLSKCIKVTYSGSLDATVKMYASSVNAVGQYIDLVVTTGTGASAACTDFVADAGGAVFTGTLKGFADTYSSFATGLADNPGTTATKWAQNDAVTYRFALTLQDNNAANGGATALTTGDHTLTWRAENQ